MADENDKAGAQGTRRFRLPKLFADAEGNGGESGGEGLDEASLAAGGAEASPDANGVAAFNMARQPAVPAPAHTAVEAAGGDSATSEEILEYVAGMAQELLSLREKISGVAEALGDMSTRESTQEKVFNTLHAELGDYKKDFIYEHLKPVVRPLLFLFDSLEQFDGEVEQYEKPLPDERRGLSPRLVRENIAFFRDQLVEALRVCEVVMMEAPEGAFNAKMQKAIGVESVGPEAHNTIVRVVRSGWFLNGQLLRPAEVIVGKAPQ